MSEKFDPEKMNEAAKQADNDLRILFEKEGKNLLAIDLIQWFLTWYMLAGHRRLGRIIVKIGNELKK